MRKTRKTIGAGNNRPEWGHMQPLCPPTDDPDDRSHVLRAEAVGRLMWESHSEQTQGSNGDGIPAECGLQALDSHQLTVHCSATDGSSFEGRTAGIRGRRLFIETKDLLPVGSVVTMEFVGLQVPREGRTASGTVAWICCQADQFNFAPGMGVRLLESPPSQGRQGRKESRVDPSIPPGRSRPLC